jgi:hypothetical protein
MQHVVLGDSQFEVHLRLRWSELAGLKVARVDLMRRRVEVAEAVTEIDGGTIVWGTPKSHERRSVPIPRFLADDLMPHLAGRAGYDLVFTPPAGGVMRNRTARRAWFNRAATAIGEPGVTPHELRHTAASLAASAGANVKAVQRMLGHASAAMTLDPVRGPSSTTIWTRSQSVSTPWLAQLVCTQSVPRPKLLILAFLPERLHPNDSGACRWWAILGSNQ